MIYMFKLPPDDADAVLTKVRTELEIEQARKIPQLGGDVVCDRQAMAKQWEDLFKGGVRMMTGVLRSVEDDVKPDHEVDS